MVSGSGIWEWLSKGFQLSISHEAAVKMPDQAALIWKLDWGFQDGSLTRLLAEGCISQVSPKRNQWDINIYKKRNWLTFYGGWEVPKSAVSQPETQERQCYSSNPSTKAQEPGEPMVSVLIPKPGGWRPKNTSFSSSLKAERLMSQLKLGKRSSLLVFLLHSSLQLIAWGPSTLRRNSASRLEHQLLPEFPSCQTRQRDRQIDR